MERFSIPLIARGTPGAADFSYASPKRNHCEQPLVSLSEPPSSVKDEKIKFQQVKRVSKLVLALARAYSYVTAAIGRASCVVIKGINSIFFPRYKTQ